MNQSLKGTLASWIILFLLTTNLQAGLLITEPSPQQDSLDAASMNRAAEYVLAPVYPYLAEYITETFKLHNTKGTGIDVGGGPGNLVTELCRHTENIYWIDADINPWYLPYVNRKAAKKHCQDRVGFIRADAMDLPFKDNYADVVVSRASFHFWKDMEKGFAEIIRILKPGGKALIGRGFPPNMPVETAKSVRNRQNKRITGYNPEDFARQFRRIMKKSDIEDYTILIPRQQAEVQYGIWIVFTR